MTNLQLRVEQAFAQNTGHQHSLLVQAPGRVNLIGEHTDYNEGFVMPAAINFQTLIASDRRSDGSVRVWALDLDATPDEFSLNSPIVPSSDHSWANYVRGAVKILQDEGCAIGGADLAIAGDIPKGTGLSSSASLLVAVIETFRGLYNLDITPTQVALLAQKAENNFVGVNVGIMDQLISARGEKGHALLIDCRSLDGRLVSIPDELKIMIVNSGVERGLVDSAYNERREQCSAAAAFFGVESLRDVDLDILTTKGAGLDPVMMKRARHVVTENARTQEMAEAMLTGDLTAIGRLMAQSHASMRDDFEITVPKIDELVAILQEEIGDAGGARMTGGGFGGCTVALVRADRAGQVSEAVAARYKTPNGSSPSIYICTAEVGAGPLFAAVAH